MEQAHQKKSFRWFKNLWIFLILLFLFLPMIQIFIFSFNTSKMNIVWEGFTLQWYGSFWKNRSLMRSVKNTLIVAGTSTLCSTIIGTVGAIGLKKYNFPGKKIIEGLLYVPIVVPEVVVGISLLAFYSLAHLPLGLLTIILSHITFCIPYVLINVRASLSGFELSQEEASMDLGANPFTTFFKVVLPQILPGVGSGAMLAFSLSMDDVVITYFTTGPGSTTLPLKILGMVKTGVTPEVNALSTVIMLVMILVIVLMTLFQTRQLKKLRKAS